MIRELSLFHLFIVLLVSLASWAIATPHYAYNVAFGGAVAGLNIIVIVWTMQKIFQKKSVALAVSVIVIKYAALLGLFFLLYSLGWRLDFGFALGLTALFPTLGFMAYRYLKQGEKNGSF